MVSFQLVESWDWAGAGDVHENQHKMSRATWHSGDPVFECESVITRNDAFTRLGFLARLSANGYRALVGLSFPFSIPVREKKNSFIDGSTTWLDFSNTVHARLVNEEGRAIAFYGRPSDYGLGTFADHFAHVNQGIKNVGPRFSDVYRVTERRMIDLGISVQSVFRLSPPMIGVHAISGIYLLQCLIRLCVAKQMPLTIWPLGYLDRKGVWTAGRVNWEDSGMVLVEIDPRLSYQAAGTQFLRLSSHEESANAVRNLGSHVPRDVVMKTYAGHLGAPLDDAVVTLLQLLSPVWFRAQVCPGLPQGAHHLAVERDDHLATAASIRIAQFKAARSARLVTTDPIQAIEGWVFGA